VLGVLDLPAEGAGEVALKQRFQLDEKRELVDALELLLGEVASNTE
jgi:hypothetical protein